MEVFYGGSDGRERCVDALAGIFLEEIYDRKCRGEAVHEMYRHVVGRLEVGLVVSLEVELLVRSMNGHIVTVMDGDTGAVEDIVEDLFGGFILGEGDVESGRTIFGFGRNFPPVPEPAVTFRVILAVFGEFKVELFRVDGNVHFGADESDREALRQSVFPDGDGIGFDEDVSAIDVLVGDISEADVVFLSAEAERTVGFESGRFGITFDTGHGFEDEILESDFVLGEAPDDFIAGIFEGCVYAEMSLQAEQDGFVSTVKVGAGRSDFFRIDWHKECVDECVERRPVLPDGIFFVVREKSYGFSNVERVAASIFGCRFDLPDGVFSGVFHEFLIGCFAADEDEAIIERHGDVAVETSVTAFVSIKSSIEVFGHF